MKKISTTIQTRFADADSLQHINNVNLQHYFDLGKTCYFAEVLELKEYASKESFIIASIATSYMSQVRLWDKIYVTTEVEKIGNKSITLLQQIINGENDELKAECRSVMVAFNFENQESIVVKEEWREKML